VDRGRGELGNEARWLRSFNLILSESLRMTSLECGVEIGGGVEEQSGMVEKWVGEGGGNRVRDGGGPCCDWMAVWI